MTFVNDKDGVSYAMFLAFSLAFMKDIQQVPPIVQNQIKAYTNWNLFMLLFRNLFSLKQWDPFLCVNSMSILLSFKTAFANGLEENLRDKMKIHGLQLTKLQFILGDLLVHHLPAAFFLYNIIRYKRTIPQVSTTYALTLSTWFAYCQVGNLNGSDLYVPHPWKRAWFSFFVTSLLTPKLTQYIIQKDKYKTILCILGLILPLTLSRLDSKMKDKYNFEYKLKKSKYLIKNRHFYSQRCRSEPYNLSSSYPEQNFISVKEK